MPRRAVYVTGWVVVTTVATVVGLAAVGVVRGAFQGNDTVTALSQQQVTEQLQSVTPTTAATTPQSGQTGGSAGRQGSQGPAGSSPPATTASSPATATPSATRPATAPTATRTASPRATTSSSESEHASPTPSPSRTTAPSSYQAFTSAGGTVYASCTGGQVSGRAVPANDYWIGEQELGPDTHITVEFVSRSGKITVEVYCSGTTMTSHVSSESDS